MISKLILIVFVCYGVEVMATNSLTLVIDTTFSMKQELDIIRTNMPMVLNAIKSENVTNVGEYIVVPFNDPDVLPPSITTNSEEFISMLYRLSVGGGRECPENSVAGIQKALETSRANSKIFVFSDAFAKENSDVDAVKRLCKTTASQVFIFVSGHCASVGPHKSGSIQVYQDITSACSGITFQFNELNIRYSFRFMKEIITSTWSTSYSETQMNGPVKFSVNSFTKRVMFVVIGRNPTIEILNSYGARSRLQTLVHTTHAMVTRMELVTTGDYTVNTGVNALTIFTQNELSLQYGFSPKRPRYLNETSQQPIVGDADYILIQVPQNVDVVLKSVDLCIETDSSVITNTVNLEKTKEGSKFYTALLPYDSSSQYDFKFVLNLYKSDKNLQVHGADARTSQNFTENLGTVKSKYPVLNPETIYPEVSIIDQGPVVVEYESQGTLACLVKASPEPSIWWEDETGNRIRSEEAHLDPSYLHISYLNLDAATTSQSYFCKANNSLGSVDGRITVNVHRNSFLELIQKPQDGSFEYGSEGKLYCEVNSYPEATIQWSHNDTKIKNSDNIEISYEDNTLTIKEMTLDNAGAYICEVTHEGDTKRYFAEVKVSGLEAPHIDKEVKAEINVTPGASADIDCSVTRGRPKPEILWKYYSSSSTLETIPSDIQVEDGRISISEIKTKHKGIYRCLATNMMGEDYLDFTVNVQTPPLIQDGFGSDMTVREGESVHIRCDVAADPKATVVWTKTRDGNEFIQLDDRQTVDEDNSLKFEASWKDNGDYRCTAENEIGSAEKIVRITVLVDPYIKAPESKYVQVHTGDSVTLPCQVMYGNPKPNVSWEFTNKHGRKMLLRSGTTEEDLHIDNVTKYHEGSYDCTARNFVRSDSINLHLSVV